MCVGIVYCVYVYAFGMHNQLTVPVLFLNFQFKFTHIE